MPITITMTTTTTIIMQPCGSNICMHHVDVRAPTPRRHQSPPRVVRVVTTMLYTAHCAHCGRDPDALCYRCNEGVCLQCTPWYVGFHGCDSCRYLAVPSAMRHANGDNTSVLEPPSSPLARAYGALARWLVSFLTSFHFGLARLRMRIFR